MQYTTVQLELLKVFQLDALELTNARDRGKILHKSKDISAAGDEVEIVFREILRRKLPNRYYVGHGHIVDKSLNSSPQFDVIIADNTNAPILFRSQKGSEYFPYESVYAIGEVKSAYYKDKKPIEVFVENLILTKSNLNREKTSPNATGLGIDFSTPLTKYPYRNPLFSFMIFVDSNDFVLDAIKDFYVSTNTSDLPNIICFLDKGIILSTQVSYTGTGELKTGFINIIPEFSSFTNTGENRFMFCPSEDKTYQKGGHLSNLFYVLLSHLQECKLDPADIKNYLLAMMCFENVQMVDWEPSLNVLALRANVNEPGIEETLEIQKFRRFLDVYDSSDSKTELENQLNEMLRSR